MSARTPKSRNSALKAHRLKLAASQKQVHMLKAVRNAGALAHLELIKGIEDAAKNTWWFCHETEYPEEGAQLIAAPTAEAAEAILRKSWGKATPDNGLDECEVSVEPADDLEVIETWLRSEDPHGKAGVEPWAVALPVLSPTWPYVLAFAIRMEAKLEKNRHKGNREGWLKETAENLLVRADEEINELALAIGVRRTTTGSAERIANEAADVANFAMMIADVCGGVKP